MTEQEILIRINNMIKNSHTPEEIQVVERYITLVKRKYPQLDLLENYEQFLLKRNDLRHIY